MNKQLKSTTMERRISADRLAKLAGKSEPAPLPQPQEPVATRKAVVRKPASLRHSVIQTTH